MTPTLKDDLTAKLEQMSVGNPQAAGQVVAVFNEWKGEHRVTEVEDYTFAKRELSNVDFTDLTLRKVTFHDCNLNAALFHNATLDTVRFSRSDGATLLQSAVFNHATMDGVHLSQCNLKYASFAGAKLTGCNLSKSDLRDAQFQNASLIRCDLRGIQVNSNTSFSNLVDATGSTIDQYTLACLGKDRGYLTDGILMKMNVVDDVALLRSQFGGYWTIFHLAAILIFVFPYAWFLLSRWAEASFRPPIEGQPTMMLLEALLRFIVTGGRDWRHSWEPSCSLLVFILFLLYNAARAALLWKTTKLKMQQDITGLPVEFSLQNNDWWQDVYKFTVQGFWWAVGLAIVNSILFLMMRIPVD